MGTLSYLLFLVLLGSLYWLRNSEFSLDDSFITYRYAYHLKEGYGFVFNVGEPYYGTTAAGYAVVLAGISTVFSSIENLFTIATNAALIIPAISVALSTLALFVIAALLPIIANSSGSLLRWLIPVIGAIFLFCSNTFNAVAGHETYPFLSLSLLGTVLIGYFRAYLAGGFFLTMAAMIRPDAILLLGIAPTIDWFNSEMSIRSYLKNRNVLGYILICTVLGLVWFSYLIYCFGTIIPGTMAAKKAQAVLGYWPCYTPETLLNYLLNPTSYSGIFIAFVGLVSFAGGIRKKIEQNAVDGPENFVAVTWLTFGILSMCAYFSFNVTFQIWYGVPIVFFIFIVAIVGWSKFIRWVESENRWDKPGITRHQILITLIFSLVFILLEWEDVPNVKKWVTTSNLNPHISAYSEIVEYIRKDSPEGATIQIAEPGSVGYHLGPKFKMVDELGLISPGVAQALIRGDFFWALNKWHPKYLVWGWDGRFCVCFNNPQIGGYERIGEFNRVFWWHRYKRGAILYRLKNL